LLHLVVIVVVICWRWLSCDVTVRRHHALSHVVCHHALSSS